MPISDNGSPKKRSTENDDLMAQWDEVFESNDATRVLDPVVFEEKTAPIAREKVSFTTGETEKIGQNSPISSTSPLYISDEEYTPLEVLEEEPSSSTFLPQQYNRLQVLPTFLGWLVSYAVLQIATTLTKPILRLLGAENFGVIGNLIPALQKDTTTAIPWLVSLGISIVLAYLAGGYSASRMARYAPSKQGIGVFLWGVLAMLLASLFTLFFSPQGKPLISYQNLAAENFSTGLIGVLVFFALAFISCLLGSLFGRRFERIHQNARNKPHRMK